MTGNKEEKRAARERQQRLGESYTTARMHVRAAHQDTRTIVRVSPVWGDHSVIAYVFGVVDPPSVLRCLEEAQRRVPSSVVGGADFNMLHEGTQLYPPGVSGFLRFPRSVTPRESSLACQAVAAAFNHAGFDASIAPGPFAPFWLVASPEAILTHHLARRQRSVG